VALEIVVDRVAEVGAETQLHHQELRTKDMRVALVLHRWATSAAAAVVRGLLEPLGMTQEPVGKEETALPLALPAHL
jgi:hypothetical protein